MQKKDLSYKYNHVLLLDDNDLDNFINQKILESAHFCKTISVNTNGIDVLTNITTLINSNGSDSIFPEVMFVDLNMPVMSGFEFIANLKGVDHPILQKCKIVILTSSIDNEDRIKVGKIDSNIVFLNKPLTSDLLSSL